MKKIIIILIVAALAGAGYFYFFKPKAPSDLRFMTTHVTKGNIVSRVLATGTLEGYKQVSVGAQVSGQLQKLYVDAGDEVKQGQLLAQIDSRTQQNALKDAQSQLNTYKAQLVAKQATLKRATLEFNRQQNMLKSDASAKADFEAAEASLAQAKADVNVVEQQIKQAEIKVDTAKINVGYTKIEAPIDGTVIAIVTDEGQTVVSNQTATTILKLATMDTMTVKAEISEADVIKIKPGMEVEFTILGDPKRVFKSTLKKIAPAPQSASSSSNTTTSSTSTAIYYNAEFDVPNDDRVLRVSMTAECSIILAQKKDVLVSGDRIEQRFLKTLIRVEILAECGQKRALPFRILIRDLNSLGFERCKDRIQFGAVRFRIKCFDRLFAHFLLPCRPFMSYAHVVFPCRLPMSSSHIRVQE